MKNRSTILVLLLMNLILASCEDTVVVDLGKTEPAIVIDAWIDNQPRTQTILLTLSKNFYDTDDYESINAASIQVENVTTTSERVYVFDETSPGVYQWTPEFDGDYMGIMGDTYKLTVAIAGEQYEATTTLNPTPAIDSIIFTYQKEEGFYEEGYTAEFFATDLEGLGNNYWIKPFYNGAFMNKPLYISTSEDGTFSDSTTDQIVFITPLRTSINPSYDDGGPFQIGDSTSLELHGIDTDTRRYLNEIATQTNREGSISELFSVPMTNLTGNIRTIAGNNEALGYFSISSLSTAGLKLSEEEAQKAVERANAK